MLRLLLFIVILGFTSDAFAQEKKVHGKITRPNGTGISGATVMLHSIENNKLLTYAIADVKGEFNATFSYSGDKIIVEVSMLGYETRKDTLILSGGTTSYNTELSEKIVELETVVIKANKIDDTVKLLTGRLVLNERSTLKDILNQTDGFIISEDGSIAYRGRQITKVLINNKEVFINQNKIALENLNFGIMDNLELINNYRDKFNIDFSNFKESIININTKKEFKGVLKFTGEGAGGHRDKFEARFKAFYFSDRLNSFLTNNINNIGQKDFSIKDMPNSFTESSSTFFKSKNSFYFQPNDLVKKALDINNSFTIRKEGNKYRLGTIIYHTQASQTQETELLSYASIDNQKVKEEISTFTQKGKMISGNIQWGYLLNNKSALNFSGTMGYSSNTNNGMIDIQNYIPSSAFINEQKQEKANTILLDANLNIKTMLNPSTRLTTGIQFFNENTKPRIQVAFNPPVDTVWQSFSFGIRHAKIFSELEKRYSSLFTTGIGISAKYIYESLSPDYKQTAKTREALLWEPALIVRGKRNYWEYNARLAPQLFHFYIPGNEKNRKRPEIISSLHYMPDGNNDVWVSYSQRNYMPDIYNDLDTLILSFNNRLINRQPIYNTISSTSNWQIGYYHSNLTQLNNFGISYSNGVNYDNLEAVFESVSNNVFYYKNMFIPKRRWQQLDANIGKGFYFTDAYHKIYFTASTLFNQSRFQTLVQNDFTNFKNNASQYSGSVRFEPQEWIISKISIGGTWRTEELFLEKENINTQKSVRLMAEISRKENKFDFELSGGFLRLSNKETDFTTPLLNLKTTLQLKGSWQIYLKGRNLLHLVNAAGTPFTGLSIQSEGNFVHQQINRYNMNYLIAGLIYKP
jgi:hypothetical protein